MDSNFLRAISVLLDVEKRTHTNYDHDVETNFGITKLAYPNLDLSTLTETQAIEIYHNDWWLKNNYHKIECLPLAIDVLLAAVNIGPKKANIMLQYCQNLTSGAKVIIDGIVGELTLKAINSNPNLGWLRNCLQIELLRYYTDRSKSAINLLGWVRRVFWQKYYNKGGIGV